MDKDNRALPLRIAASIWRGLDRLRRLLHLIPGLRGRGRSSG